MEEYEGMRENSKEKAARNDQAQLHSTSPKAGLSIIGFFCIQYPFTHSHNKETKKQVQISLFPGNSRHPTLAWVAKGLFVCLLVFAYEHLQHIFQICSAVPTHSQYDFSRNRYEAHCESKLSRAHHTPADPNWPVA